jgi:hypothetical protein
MAQWGQTESSSNAVKWGPSALATVTSNTTTSAALFNNTTISAFVSGQGTGVFAVSAAEVATTSGPIVDIVITYAGSGYPANAAVTITGGGGSGATANALANSTGRIAVVYANQTGSAFTSNPGITIDPPTPIVFSGNSTNVTVGNSTAKGFITLGLTNTALWANGDALRYLVATGNTAVGGLANNGTYYVLVSNTTAIQLSDTQGGAAINLASVAAGAQAGHDFTGARAIAVAAIGGGRNKGVTAGWALRREGTGGRAGRVSYESLVAMRSIVTDSADDNVLPDA